MGCMYGTCRSARLLLIVAVCLGILGVCGCGQPAGGAGSVPPTPLAPVTPAAVTAYAHFGDSVTCGGGTSAPANGYAALMDATVAGPNTNFCHWGDEAADTAVLVYANADPTVSGTQAYTAMTGTNDVWVCGTYPGCTARYTAALSASLAWLAIPASDKVLAQAITVRSGSWSNDDTVRPGLGLASSTAGSSLTFPVKQAVAGRNLYLAWKATVGSAGSATVAVDGTVVDTVGGHGNGAEPAPTPNGGTVTVFLKTYPLGAVGTHTVTVTVAPGAPAGDAFTLLWGGAPSATYTRTGVPHLIAGGILSEKYGLRTDVTALYDGIVQTVVNGLRADGLDVQFAAVHDVLTAPEDYVDILHPNDAGHAKIAQAFLHPE